MKKIKVLVVDDSLLFQEFLHKAIDSDSELEVVATAKDPFDARDAIMKYNPDVMTLDVEMPRMNGIEFLRQLLPQYKLPTIMVSSLNEVVFDALAVGAVDFVTKPSSMSKEDIDAFVKNELIPKIKTASTSKILAHKTIPPTKNKFNSSSPNRRIDDDTLSRIASKISNQHFIPSNSRKSVPIDVIAIGASTGGTEAIFSVLSKLKSDMPGIIVTQHMPPGFTQMYAKRLDNKTCFSVKEAETGDIVKRGTVLVAPGDKHLTVYKEGSIYRAVCAEGVKVSGHCPSVDILFSSVADSAHSNALGVILTGMGGDGATGLKLMQLQGAETIGQDEASCVVYGMPKVAYNMGAVKYQLPLQSIPQKITQLINLANANS